MTEVDPDAELAAATGDLYAGDPADFVAARNEAVRRLRKEGNRDLAERVAKLRRPSPAAWAVNQLARHHQADLADLIRLGDALRTAQARMLAGADAGALRDAGKARREAVARLAESAVGLMAERVQGAGAHEAAIIATLEAASLDPQAAAEVSRGRLTSSLEPPSGFGDLGMGAAQPIADGPASGPRQGEKPDEATSGVDKHAASTADAERALAEARTEAADLLADARDAAALLARRNREVADAEAQVSRLQHDLDEARGRATAGRRGADRAQKAADAADAEAAGAVERCDAAEQRLAELRSTQSG